MEGDGGGDVGGGGGCVDSAVVLVVLALVVMVVGMVIKEGRVPGKKNAHTSARMCSQTLCALVYAPRLV